MLRRKAKRKNLREEAVFEAEHCHFGRLYFVHYVKSLFKKPIFGTGSKLLTNQVLMEVDFHSHKESQNGNFEQHMQYAKIKAQCENGLSNAKIGPQCEIFALRSVQCEISSPVSPRFANFDFLLHVLHFFLFSPYVIDK